MCLLRKLIFFICIGLLFISKGNSQDVGIPGQVGGIQGVHILPGTMTLMWDSVDHDVNGKKISSPVTYNVYRRSSIWGPAVKVNSYPVKITVYCDRISNEVVYYTVRAVSFTGDESVESLLIESGPKANLLFAASDNVSSVMIPGKMASLLCKKNNGFGVPLSITSIENSLPDDPTIIRSVQFKIVKTDTQEEVQGFEFPEESVEIQLGFSLFNGKVARGTPLIENTNAVTKSDPKDLSLYWERGPAWIMLNGQTNPETRTIKTNSKYLGSFQVRGVSPSMIFELAKVKVYPSLLTPNGDGKNDHVFFLIDNPNGVQISGTIYDLSGHFVKTITALNTHAVNQTELEWDGSDLNNSIVPNGLYVYRIQGENQKASGTVGVVR